MNKQLTPQEQEKMAACINEVGLKDLKIDINEFTTIENSKKYLHQKIDNEAYTFLLYIFFSFLSVVVLNSIYISYIIGVFVIALLYFLATVMQEREVKVAILLKKLENIHQYSMIR